MIDPRIRGHEEKIVEYVNDQVRTLRRARDERETVWRECIQAYLSEFDKRWVAKAREENRSTRFLSLTWDAVENVTSQLASMLFPNEDWFKCEPGRMGMDLMDDESAQNIEILLRYQHRQTNFRREFMKMVKWLVITGNCPWTMIWEEERAVDYPSYARAMEQWVEQQKIAFAQYQQEMTAHAIMARQAQIQGMMPPPPPQLQMPERPVGDEQIAYAGPKLVTGDPFNFVIDTAANDPRRAFRATTFWRSKAYLLDKSQPDESGYAVYENLDRVHDASRKSDEDAEVDRLIGGLYGVELPTKEQVKLVECQGDFELAFGEEREIFRGYVATVANGKTLVRFEETHLWSRDLTTQLATLIPCPGQTYGMGLVEAALGTQDAINVRTNQMIDAVAVAINPEMKVIDDGVFDPQTAESGAGALHLVGSLENLLPIQRDLSGLQLSFSEIGQMKGEFQQLTRSANPFTTQHYKKSATEVARDTSVAGTSLQEIARFVEESALQPALKMQLQFSQQYLSSDVKLRVVQNGIPEWRDVNPQTVRQNWDVNVVGSQSQMLKEQRMQDLMMFFQMVSGNPMTVQMVNLPYLMRVIYREMGFTDADQVFTIQPPIPGGMYGPAGPEGPGGVDPALAGPGAAAAPAGVHPAVAATAEFEQQAQHALMGNGAGLG